MPKKSALSSKKVPYKEFVLIYDERRVLSTSDKVEQCFRARPLENRYTLCNCSSCTPHSEKDLTYARWMDKATQHCIKTQQDICCCSPNDGHYEFMA
jgi:hypothetical protein